MCQNNPKIIKWKTENTAIFLIKAWEQYFKEICRELTDI